jgi:hypothetical protein
VSVDFDVEALAMAIRGVGVSPWPSLTPAVRDTWITDARDLIARYRAILSERQTSDDEPVWGVWLVPGEYPLAVKAVWLPVAWVDKGEPPPTDPRVMARAIAESVAAQYNAGNVWRAEVRRLP